MSSKMERTLRTHTHTCVLWPCHTYVHVYCIYVLACVVCLGTGVFTWISEGWLVAMKHLQGERGNGGLLGLSPQETPAKTSK